MITLIGGCLHDRRIREGEFNFLGAVAIPLDREKTIYAVYTRPDNTSKATVAYFEEYIFRKEA